MKKSIVVEKRNISTTLGNARWRACGDVFLRQVVGLGAGGLVLWGFVCQIGAGGFRHVALAWPRPQQCSS